MWNFEFLARWTVWSCGFWDNKFDGDGQRQQANGVVNEYINGGDGGDGGSMS